MTLADLIAAARIRVDDNVKNPYLCSDETFTRFANWAQDEAARRGRLLVDSGTDEICRLDLPVGEPLIDLDCRVLFIRRAKMDDRSVPLRRLSHHRLDAGCPGWEDETGEPRGYVTDMQDGKFRPYPIPTVAQVVHLTVSRLPLNALSKDKDVPELPARTHEALVAGMAYKYYSIPDTEMYDKESAAVALAEFEAEFGKKSSILDEQWMQREADHFDEEGQF